MRTNRNVVRVVALRAISSPLSVQGDVPSHLPPFMPRILWLLALGHFGRSESSFDLSTSLTLDSLLSLSAFDFSRSNMTPPRLNLPANRRVLSDPMSPTQGSGMTSPVSPTLQAYSDKVRFARRPSWTPEHLPQGEFRLSGLKIGREVLTCHCRRKQSKREDLRFKLDPAVSFSHLPTMLRPLCIIPHRQPFKYSRCLQDLLHTHSLESPP